MRRRRFASWVLRNWFAGWTALFASVAVHRRLCGEDVDPFAAQWLVRVGAFLFFWWVAASFMLLFSMHVLEREYGAAVEYWQRRLEVCAKRIFRRCRRALGRNG